MLAESLIKLRQSGLFDERYYNTQLKVPLLGDKALEHYLLFGVVQKLNPHPLFISDYYLEVYPDVDSASINPLIHFIEFGFKENRSPHPLFDCNFYLDQFRPGDRSSIIPFFHYLNQGWMEGKNPHPMFDSEYYVRENRELLADADLNPLVHYLATGHAIGCNPHPFFDSKHYLSKLSRPMPDGFLANPLVHFVLCGVHEAISPHPKIASDEIVNYLKGRGPHCAEVFMYGFSSVDRSAFGNVFENSKRQYVTPDFLLAPADDSVIELQFSIPTLKNVVSQLCTASQFGTSEYLSWCKRLKKEPQKSRKLWEYVFILSALEQSGALKSGNSGIGFGTGQEPLPSFFASLEIDVLATDAPAEIAEAWTATMQCSTSAEMLFDEGIVERERFERHVRHALVDMNSIPSDLRGYDFCWSSCALEHLGSIDKGLSFIENSLDCVKPGGVVVHTTEFNLDSNSETIDNEGTVLFRRRDIELLSRKLALAGHEVFPLNLCTGDEKVDHYIDVPPFSLPHLKLQVSGFTTTSFGLVVRKRLETY
jgi:hypothetical protein